MFNSILCQFCLLLRHLRLAHTSLLRLSLQATRTEHNCTPSPRTGLSPAQTTAGTPPLLFPWPQAGLFPLQGKKHKVPKFTQIASSYWFRFCLYAWLGSLLRSVPGKSGIIGVLICCRILNCLCDIYISSGTSILVPTSIGWGNVRRFRQQFLS